MNRLLSPIVIFFLLATAVPSPANNLKQASLKDTPAIAIVREDIILKGITACKARKYRQTIQLLRTFLNPRRIIANSTEKKGFSCLAIAYQNVGKPVKARETILQAISISENSPIELANFENTAGTIAYWQNEKMLANKHWETARQLYSDSDRCSEWAKITFNLAKNYRELGYIAKSQRLHKELNDYRRLKYRRTTLD